MFAEMRSRAVICAQRTVNTIVDVTSSCTVEDHVGVDCLTSPTLAPNYAKLALFSSSTLWKIRLTVACAACASEEMLPKRADTATSVHRCHGVASLSHATY